MWRTWQQPSKPESDRRTCLPTEQIKEKLADLQRFIQQLAHTPHGQADLQQRVRMFGECMQDACENDRDFYGKLRRWLERDCEELTGTKSGSPLAWS